MGKFYYAIDCPRGIRTASPLDTLFRFDSKSGRDRFVNEEPLSRMPVTRKAAASCYPLAFKHTEFFEPDRWTEDWNDYGHCNAWIGDPTGGVYSDVR